MLSSYVPPGRFATVSRPASSVRASRASPVERSRTVTRARGTTAPVWSVTVPTIEPYRTWPAADGGKKAAASQKPNNAGIKRQDTAAPPDVRISTPEWIEYTPAAPPGVTLPADLFDF